MDSYFKNKVVIITGGSFGIGQATAMAFARLGATITIADLQENSQTMDAIKAMGGQVLFSPCDVSQSKDVKAMVYQTMDKFGRLDFAFNNAGIEGKTQTIADSSEDDSSEENFDKTTAINLKGIWLCMKYQLPHMINAGKGAIVNCSSVAGKIGFPGAAAYVASKHGVLGLTKTAALENAQRGIRINAVCPGVIKTPMIDRVTGKNKEAEHQYESLEPMNRMGLPQEIAQAVVWLCSEEASFVTGHAMDVDGGWLAG
ncbi:glucose 1-dehydrogenase [Xanthocytophaga agilis]|uniref:SDR family oxidoreductase n=1 Tax=Xanthocytophaga agilis TaxID=3048010 RepID=A0AAE3RDI8_9BACT|nr:glucose 1-dehydrogenase [Xanthocytophaga agilis]MDJ1506449.1 SDR family oxidoreductase [Xanthocytophaga agilis]